MLLGAEQLFSVYLHALLWGTSQGDFGIGIKLALSITIGDDVAFNILFFDLAFCELAGAAWFSLILREEPHVESRRGSRS
jgi:hypothetical protein